jgi:hypothetical protein
MISYDGLLQERKRLMAEVEQAIEVYSELTSDSVEATALLSQIVALRLEVCDITRKMLEFILVKK